MNPRMPLHVDVAGARALCEECDHYHPERERCGHWLQPCRRRCQPWNFELCPEHAWIAEVVITPTGMFQ